ncbi:MAG: 16S rRNA (uracil(1498)-N(3))-methyltransferase [Clostridia bacterium]|nr:16S rRNA (uracil(1498)-N(3))-methyltransferase [Clostridia bacterium]
MPRFFIRADQVENTENGKIVNIIGEDAHHISRSLRMAQGEKIDVCDMQKTVYECELLSFEQDTVKAKVINESQSDTEPPCHIKLYQAIPKGDKLETVIQKSVECGVCEIIPFSSERCIAKIDKKDAPKKALRHNKISESAAKQSGRGIIPPVHEAMSFKEAMAHAKNSDLMIFCYEGDGTRTLKEILREKTDIKTVSVVIGAEGGFSIKEVEYAKELGAHLAGLGKRILRCETAGAFALACIIYEREM